MKVFLTPQARDDLDAIADHIARDSPRRARSFVRELVAAAQGIGRAPGRFQYVERYARLGIRRRVHGAYLILYRVEPGRVVVIHVVHGARDLEAVLD